MKNINHSNKRILHTNSIKKVLTIGGDLYYSICITDYTSKNIELIITYPSIEYLKKGIKKYIKPSSLILFDNQNLELLEYLVHNYEDNLVRPANIFKTNDCGFTVGDSIKSRGGHSEVITSIERCTNLENYYMNRNKYL